MDYPRNLFVAAPIGADKSSLALELTKVSVDMKVLIEQMREQVQNAVVATSY